MSTLTIVLALITAAFLVFALYMGSQMGRTGDFKGTVVLGVITALMAFNVIGSVINDCSKDPATLAWYYKNMSIDVMNLGNPREEEIVLVKACDENGECTEVRGLDPCPDQFYWWYNHDQNAGYCQRSGL